MNEDQIRIASDAIARVVANAAEDKERPNAAALKTLAQDCAEAIVAGFAKLAARPSAPCACGNDECNGQWFRPVYANRRQPCPLAGGVQSDANTAAISA